MAEAGIGSNKAAAGIGRQRVVIVPNAVDQHSHLPSSYHPSRRIYSFSLE
jgi:hypothetical protein